MQTCSAQAQPLRRRSAISFSAEGSEFTSLRERACSAAIEKRDFSIILLVSRLVLGAALRAPRVSSVTPRNSSSLSAQLSSVTQMASEAVHYDLLVRPA